MSKKMKKSKDVFSYYANDDEFEKEINDDLENYEKDEPVEETGEIEISTEEAEELEEGKNILLNEIKTLPNGEDRSRAIGDLKEIEAMIFARRRYRRKKEKMSEELRIKEQELKNEFLLKQKELEQEREKMDKELALKKAEIIQNRELHEEEIKVQKRGTFISVVANVLMTVLSLGAYGVLLDKQNKFESGENYSTSGSRGLTNNIAQIPRSFGKR